MGMSRGKAGSLEFGTKNELLKKQREEENQLCLRKEIRLKKNWYNIWDYWAWAYSYHGIIVVWLLSYWGILLVHSRERQRFMSSRESSARMLLHGCWKYQEIEFTTFLRSLRMMDSCKQLLKVIQPDSKERRKRVLGERSKNDIVRTDRYAVVRPSVLTWIRYCRKCQFRRRMWRRGAYSTCCYLTLLKVQEHQETQWRMPVRD